MADLVLKKGRIVFTDGVREGDVVVDSGMITEITNDYRGEATRVIDCTDKFIFPGVIDAHVHMRVPGMQHKEDFATGSMAAIAGGVTTFLDMPNTVPPTISKKMLAEKRSLVEGQSLADYGLFFGATDDNFAEIQDVRNIAGVKVYMGESTGRLIVRTDAAMENLFSYGKYPIVVHAEEQGCLERFAREMATAGGVGGTISGAAVHSAVRPSECAREAVKRALHMAKKFEARAHIAHVTSRDELEFIEKFKSDRVTCEVTPHHLLFDIGDYERLGNRLKVNPPVRAHEDCEALWKALNDGVIDVIASDHAPHLLSEKDATSYGDVPAGVPGVETMLPAMLDAANRGLVNLDVLARALAANPARIFGVPRKGSIAVGNDADLVVIDMALERTMTNEMILSKCGWTPFAGKMLKGWPIMTIKAGEVAYEAGKFVSSRRGKEIDFVLS